VIVEGISSEELYIVKPKAMCHITKSESYYASEFRGKIASCLYQRQLLMKEKAAAYPDEKV